MTLTHKNPAFRAATPLGVSILVRPISFQKEQAMPYSVYLINQVGTWYYKIGITRQVPAWRMSALQCGNPNTLKFVHIINVPAKIPAMELESFILMNAKRMKIAMEGEWMDFGKTENPQETLENLIEKMDIFTTLNICQNPIFWGPHKRFSAI